MCLLQAAQIDVMMHELSTFHECFSHTVWLKHSYIQCCIHYVVVVAEANVSAIGALAY